MAELKTLDGVEIFSAGKWNGDNYTEKDLDAMVETFNETKGMFEPYMKIGHNEKQALLASDELPAAGYVSKLYRKGKKLIADLKDIPEKIYVLMKNKAYRNRSAEIYWNIDFNGKKYPRMLKGFALLGADMPAVATLSDILNFYGLDEEKSQKNISLENNVGFTVKVYEALDPDEIENHEGNMSEKNKEVENKLADLEKKYGELEAKHKLAEDRAKELERQNLEAEQRAKVAEIKQFAKELEAEGLCTPSMRPLIEAVIGEEQKEYSLGEGEKVKKYADKKDMLKEALKIYAEAKKVNFSEKTDNVVPEKKTEDKEGELEEKINKYALENKVSFKEAYKIVMRETEAQDGDE